MLSLYVLLSLAILLLLVLHLVTRTKNPSVPGPTPLPIIGNLLTMLPFAKINRPGLCFEAVAKQYGPVARLTLPGKDIVIVTSHALAKRVLRGDGGKFSKGTELQQALEGIAPHGLFALPDGPDWTRHRKKLQPAFGPLQLRGALEIASKLGKETYDFFDAELGAGRREQDFYKTFTCLTADTLGLLAFSYDFHNVAALKDPSIKRETYDNLEILLHAFSTRAFSAAKPFWSFLGVGRNKIDPVGDKVRATVRTVIDSRRGKSARPEKEWDVLDRLLAESQDGEPAFSLQEIEDETIAFYMAGQDAITGALSWFLYALCLHPQSQEKCLEEINRVVKDPAGYPTYDELNELRYLDACFRESMRLFTTLRQASPRTAVAETNLGGFPIAPGTLIFVNFHVMHNDPTLWDSVDSYNPQRWLEPTKKEDELPFMPFSDGTHLCPGYRLAYLQAKVFFAPLIKRFKVELVQGQELVPVEAISVALRGGMKVRLERRG